MKEIELIELYCEGKLKGKEFISFEQRLDTDKELLVKVKGFKADIKVIEVYTRMELLSLSIVSKISY